MAPPAKPAGRLVSIRSLPLGISAIRSSCGLLPCGPVRQNAILRPSCDATACSPPAAYTDVANVVSLRTEIRPPDPSRTPKRAGSAVAVAVERGDGVVASVAVGAAEVATAGEGDDVGTLAQDANSATAASGCRTRRHIPHRLDAPTGRSSA